MPLDREPRPSVARAGTLALGLVALTVFLGSRSFSVGGFHPDWQGWIFIVAFGFGVVAAPFGVIYLLEAHFDAQDKRERRVMGAEERPQRIAPVEDGGRPHWHFGPTGQDPDPGKVWCDDCGQQVYFFSEGAICSAECPSTERAHRW